MYGYMEAYIITSDGQIEGWINRGVAKIDKWMYGWLKQ